VLVVVIDVVGRVAVGSVAVVAIGVDVAVEAALVCCVDDVGVVVGVVELVGVVVEVEELIVDVDVVDVEVVDVLELVVEVVDVVDDVVESVELDDVVEAAAVTVKLPCIVSGCASHWYVHVPGVSATEPENVPVAAMAVLKTLPPGPIRSKLCIAD
jgi:hypothetical protein